MKTITLPDGTEAEATPLDFTEEDVTWDKYELEDGTTLKTRTNLASVLRLENHYDELGNPVYITHSEDQVRVLNVDEELLRDDPGMIEDGSTSDRGVQ